MLKYAFVNLFLAFLTCSFSQDRVGKSTSGRQVALVDPNCQAIVLHLYAGLLKVVPLQCDSDQPLKAFNLRYRPGHVTIM